ncbi:hypothetical protein FOMPIDRAFT_90584 [Fomitopsis schrenkii]|uniref:Uncharacterized protein n=1 Tax=Fomitopsis schrenkii TaxID=2126942 RepID=S8DRC2_FOMSC|nr:hypothetical protein FOMPIDRAFT_90584 [Fomitopsis schrenkii]
MGNPLRDICGVLSASRELARYRSPPPHQQRSCMAVYISRVGYKSLEEWERSSSHLQERRNPRLDARRANLPRVRTLRPSSSHPQPIAAPAALATAGSASSTWITASNGWGSPYLAHALSPLRPALRTGLPRDSLITVAHPMWGSFWMAAGTVGFLTACGVLPAAELARHLSVICGWMIPLLTLTWTVAGGASARDRVLFRLPVSLGIGYTFAAGGCVLPAKAMGPMMTLTWIAAAGVFARDMVLSGALVSLGIGCTLAAGGWNSVPPPARQSRRRHTCGC